MKRLALFIAALACITVSGLFVHAGMVPVPPPGPARIANADAVIVGKVEAIEPADIKIGITNYRIAVVKINDGLRGVKDEKTLRIGFVPLDNPKGDGKGPFIIRTGARPVQLQVGQEGLFILKKLENENAYTIGGVIGYYINSDKNPGFEKEVQAAKSATNVMVNPKASLGAKDVEERLLAAAILIEGYRSFRGPGAPRLAPIDAEESKLIMQTLADADWQGQGNFTSLRSSPMQLFQRLGITAKDGFTPAKGTNYQTAAQAWVRDNAQKYRIQRYVAAEGK